MGVKLFERRKPLPPPRVIAVDVDGTLYQDGEINRAVVEMLRNWKDAGFYLMLWSMRGADHGQEVVTEFQLDGLFDLICSKPGYVFDDKGWQWTTDTVVLEVPERE